MSGKFKEAERIFYSRLINPEKFISIRKNILFPSGDVLKKTIVLSFMWWIEN
jgi:hypothetical protein